MPRPSLYEILYGNFAGGLALNQVGEEEQVILSVLDNMQRILKRVDVTMQEQTQPGKLHYVIDAELKDAGLVRYGTIFMPEGRVLLRHLKQQRYVQT